MDRLETREDEHVIDIERSSDASSSGLSNDLMDRHETREDEHVIDIERSSAASSSGSSYYDLQLDLYNEDRPSNGRRLGRRSEGFGRRQWSPFNTGLWISIELLFTVGQIIAAIVVLSRSANENPDTPLFAWIVGYAAGCAATLPLIYWHYLHRNQSAEEENSRNTYVGTWSGLSIGGPNLRLNMLVNDYKRALVYFFVVWFVAGCDWIFGGHSSSAEAPNLYRLSIVFFTFSSTPFILLGMLCCCLPCMVPILYEDMNQTRVASDDSIDALPRHKFKLKGNENIKGEDSNFNVDEGGIVGAGTEQERAISGEDAVCCICLARYTDNDLLRELPCTHFFHTECVDKWLKINASCPLCKFEIGVAKTHLQ